MLKGDQEDGDSVSMYLAEKKDITQEQQNLAFESLRQGQSRKTVVESLMLEGIPKDAALRLTRRLRDQIKTGR